MSILHPEDVVQESWFILVLTGFLGLRPVRVLGTPWPGYLYMLLLIALYFCFFFGIKNTAAPDFERLSKVTSVTIHRLRQNYANLLLMPLMICSSIRCGRKASEAYLALSEVDKSLQFVNLYFRYTRNMRREVVHACAVVFLTTFFGVLESSRLVDEQTTSAFEAACVFNQLPEVLNGVSMCSFVIFLSKVRLRLLAINGSLEPLMDAVEDAAVTPSTAINDAFRLRSLRQNHRKLCRIALLVGDAYGFQILVNFIVYFGNACAHLNLLYTKFNVENNLVDTLGDLFSICFYIGKFVYVIRACQAVEAQAKVSREMWEVWNDPDKRTFQGEMRAISWQLFLKDFRFTACNCCYVDCRLLKTVVVGLIGYFVLMAYIIR